MSRQLGNPGVFGLATFGFALAVLSFQVLVNSETVGATLYAILVAAIGETIAGVWPSRGETPTSPGSWPPSASGSSAST